MFPVDALRTDCPLHVKGDVCLPTECVFLGVVQLRAWYLSPVYAHCGQYGISERLLAFTCHVVNNTADVSYIKHYSPREKVAQDILLPLYLHSIVYL